MHLREGHQCGVQKVFFSLKSKKKLCVHNVVICAPSMHTSHLPQVQLKNH